MAGFSLTARSSDSRGGGGRLDAGEGAFSPVTSKHFSMASTSWARQGRAGQVEARAGQVRAGGGGAGGQCGAGQGRAGQGRRRGVSWAQQMTRQPGGVGRGGWWVRVGEGEGHLNGTGNRVPVLIYSHRYSQVRSGEFR